MEGLDCHCGRDNVEMAWLGLRPLNWRVVLVSHAFSLHFWGPLLIKHATAASTFGRTARSLRRSRTGDGVTEPTFALFHSHPRGLLTRLLTGHCLHPRTPPDCSSFYAAFSVTPMSEFILLVPRSSLSSTHNAPPNAAGCSWARRCPAAPLGRRQSGSLKRLTSLACCCSLRESLLSNIPIHSTHVQVSRFLVLLFGKPSLICPCDQGTNLRE